jgi:GNAT superfamily N-acetyltransferase
MTSKNIRILHIKVGELNEFAEQVVNNAEPGQFVPISIQRARAHANNPYADTEDVGLLAAVDEDDEVVGYFGILPMQLRKGNEIFKTHWFTTWSVSSKVRGLGVGTQLMREALTLQKDFLIVGSVHARRVCEKFGFRNRIPLLYYWIDTSGMQNLNPLTLTLRFVRKAGNILKVKKNIPITNPTTRRVNSWLSPLTKRLIYPLLNRKVVSIFNKFDFEEVTRIRSEQVRRKDRPEVELNRGIEAINWMLSYPWIVENGQSRTEHLDYYFSDARPLYRFIVIEVFTPKTREYQGFVVFSVSEKKSGVALKTLDFRFRDPAQYQYILALAVRYGQAYRADILELPAEVTESFKGSVLGRLLLQEKKRIYQCHPKSDNSPLATAWDKISLHLYDGDMAFS